MRKILFIVVLAAAAAGCATGAKPATSAAVDSNVSTSNACRHWSNIKNDIRDGILDTAELRTKISEVRESASSSPVRSAATKLLAGVTVNDREQILSGFGDLEAACK